MKKYFKLFLLLIFTLILSGCTKEEVTSVGTGKTININTLDGVYDFSIKVKEVVGFSKLKDVFGDENEYYEVVLHTENKRKDGKFFLGMLEFYLVDKDNKVVGEQSYLFNTLSKLNEVPSEIDPLKKEDVHLYFYTYDEENNKTKVDTESIDKLLIKVPNEMKENNTFNYKKYYIALEKEEKKDEQIKEHE